ncbi:MarR family winged helix-turn-helix transcriptional regulator [Sneathiella sp.]|uniref:MarR family winged helix-turn-helix transcriptional regulator n=1 Tax=Sneathiella sp. TaxID=1964365 RepID=UPI00356721C9
MKTSDLAPHTEQTVLQFLDTASALERRLDRILSSTKGVSFSEYRLLMALSEANPTGCPRIDLANRVGLTASAVTRALKPLEKIGCVTTERSERDARQSLAVITPAGRDLLADAQAILRDALRDLPVNSLSSPKLTEFQHRLTEFGNR